MNGRKGNNWAALRNETGRFQELLVDGMKQESMHRQVRHRSVRVDVIFFGIYRSWCGAARVFRKFCGTSLVGSGNPKISKSSVWKWGDILSRIRNKKIINWQIRVILGINDGHIGHRFSR